MGMVTSADHGPVPDNGGYRPVVVALAVAVAMLVSALGVYVWQSPKVTEARSVAGVVRSDLTSAEREAAILQDEVAALRDERSRLLADADAFQARIEHLVLRAGSLEGAVGDLQGRIADLEADLAGAAAAVERSEARLEDAREQLAAVHRRAKLTAGPSLADGRYIGTIQGVDASAAPMRLAIRVTARSSGAPVGNPGWRVFAIAPHALVELTTWKDGRDVALTVPQFEHVFDGRARWNGRMRSSRYWIRISDGRVLALGEIEPRDSA